MGGGGETYVPGRRVEGGRNRREIINYRVNKRTHGQIPPPPPPHRARARSRQPHHHHRALNITLRHCRDTKSGGRGGGGGGAVRFRPDTKSRACTRVGVLYASGPIRKAGGGGGGGGGRGVAVRFRSDTKSEGGGGCRTLMTGLNNILQTPQYA